MGKGKDDNNVVNVSGSVATEFKFDHEVFGEKFYACFLDIKRVSGTVDTIKVMVSDRLVDVKKVKVGMYVEVSGQFRSFTDKSKGTGSGRHLILYVFATKFNEVERAGYYVDKNSIDIFGTICRKPTYRTTPMGRQLSDVLFAVNRSYGKSDYLPIIFWGRNANFAKDLPVGTKLHIIGRVQSREYVKKLDGAGESETSVQNQDYAKKLEEVSEPEKTGKSEIRVAYEVSVLKVYLVKEDTEDGEE